MKAPSRRIKNAFIDDEADQEDDVEVRALKLPETAPLTLSQISSDEDEEEDNSMSSFIDDGTQRRYKKCCYQLSAIFKTYLAAPALWPK